MTSNEQKTSDATYFTGDLSSHTKGSPRDFASTDLNQIQQDKYDFHSNASTLLEECQLWKKQCNELTMQKQAMEKRSELLFAENRRLIEEKDKGMDRSRETISDDPKFIQYEQMIKELQTENSRLKESKEKSEKEYDEQIQTLQIQIKELEDWNGGSQENNSSHLQSTIDMLTSRNTQLESDFQRLQLQQRNNQLALDRLDEYEETITQLQDQIDQLRSTKKKSPNNNNEHTDNNSQEIVKLTDQIQTLENENCQLRQQLQTKKQTFQITPGSPPSVDRRNPSPSDHDVLILLYDQFISLLPNELPSSDKSLSDRFADLFEQFSSYIGTFSIVQEELDSLKQILHEKQDELEKIQSHLEITTEKLTQFHEEQSLNNRNKSFDSDEDELGEILGYHHRAPSQQSLLSTTPGEKQLLLAQNELLSSLFTEKERELIELQQVEKTLRSTCQQMENEREEKLNELNDIRNILDEKLRENSSLKKDKLFFIEKLAQLERERHEQQSIIQLPPKQSTPDREKSPPSPNLPFTQEQYDQLLQLSTKQHEESLSYYNEYTRILNIYNELTGKYSQLQVECESIQSVIQQKNEAYLQCQNELNTYQNLFYHQKKKTEESDLLRSMLNERDEQLQKLIDDNQIKFTFNQHRIEEFQLDLKRVTHERDLAIVEKKQLEHHLEKIIRQAEERELKMNGEIERLLQLTDQLETKNRESEQILSTELEQMNSLQQERENRDSLIHQLQSEITQLNENFQIVNNSRVEKQLVKNILLSYFHTPIAKQQEVVPLLGGLVGFTQDEYQKAIDAINTNINGTSWLTGWLGTSSSKSKTQSEAPIYHPDKTFAELLIQYVDHQSTDDLQTPVLKLSTDESSVSTSDIATQSTI